MYKTGRYEEAIQSFNKIHSRDDDMAQSAYYHLADCYLKTGKKTEAQTAFLTASESGSNDAIREDAYFNYAKLAYDSSTPFEQPLDIFQTFLKRYPTSKYRMEANEYLASLYLNSKDYERALKGHLCSRFRAANNARCLSKGGIFPWGAALQRHSISGSKKSF